MVVSQATPPPLLEPVRLENIAKLLGPLQRQLIRNVHHTFEVEPETFLREYPRAIHVMNHGPMWAPWVVAGALAERFTAAGAGKRVPFAVIHRRLYKFSPVRGYFQKRFNSDRPFRFEEIVERLVGGDFTDFLVLPEGAYEQLGLPEEVSRFKSPRFVELALETEAPIVLTVHRGTEPWAVTLRLDAFTMRMLHYFWPSLHRRIADHATLNLPGLPAPIDTLRVHSVLIELPLKKEALSAEPRRRRQQLWEIAETVRDRMIYELRQLDREALLETL